RGVGRTLLKLFLLDTARSDRQVAGGRTYSHLVDSFRRIFTACLSLKLEHRYRRMNSAARCARRRKRDNQKYPHLWSPFAIAIAASTLFPSAAELLSVVRWRKYLADTDGVILCQKITCTTVWRTRTASAPSMYLPIELPKKPAALICLEGYF